MQELIITYQEVFQGDREIRMIQSPLRICPLGAHIDHQKGIVTGMTLDSSVNLVYCANDDGLVQVKSLDFPDEENFHIDHVPGPFLPSGAITLEVRYWLSNKTMCLKKVSMVL